MTFAKDLCAVVGLTLVAVGLWRVSPSASVVTVGALLLVAGVYGHLRTASSPRPTKPKGDEP